jgi:hypothetical protein
LAFCFADLSWRHDSENTDDKCSPALPLSRSVVLRYTVELASLHPHLDLSTNTYPISQTLDPASTTIVSTIAGRRYIVRAIRRPERPIVFASPALSLPHHAPIAFAFSPSQKGCETGSDTGRQRRPITNLPDWRSSTPVKLRRVGTSDTHTFKVRGFEEDLPLRHFGSNRSASEVWWLTEGSHALRLQGTGLEVESFRKPNPRR